MSAELLWWQGRQKGRGNVSSACRSHLIRERKNKNYWEVWQWNNCSKNVCHFFCIFSERLLDPAVMHKISLLNHLSKIPHLPRWLVTLPLYSPCHQLISDFFCCVCPCPCIWWQHFEIPETSTQQQPYSFSSSAVTSEVRLQGRLGLKG